MGFSAWPDSGRREVTIERSNRRTVGGLLVIPARVADVPVEAVIDTGSADTFGNAALRTALLIGMNVLGTARALILDYPRARVYLLTTPRPRLRITHEFFPIP